VNSVAVLGGGPAGAFAAERLARAGLKTLLFDEKLAWEKPCGGGITYKAYHEYPWLVENSTAKMTIHEAKMGAPSAGHVRLKFRQPILIYSRHDLNQMLLDRAAAAGASLEKTRVLGIEAEAGGWSVRTKSGAWHADFCIVATGARNPLRDFGSQFGPGDTMSTLGYYVSGKQEYLEIEFLKGLEGYLWVFPRDGHFSVGIGGKGEPAQSLRQRLETFMDHRGISRQGARFYSHILPSLSTASWSQNRVAGPGWMAVGDAAGLVDPITGEGIYYAIRSADIASRVLLDDTCADKAQAYREALARDFTRDLAYASTLSKRVYLGEFLWGGVPQRMVEFTRRSARFRETIQDLFAGTQPYLGLRERLYGSLGTSLREVAMSVFSS
jgi:geranylgeranyl reductase family protein